MPRSLGAVVLERKILNALAELQAFTSEDVQRVHGKSRSSARRLIADWLRAGVVDVIGTENNPRGKGKLIYRIAQPLNANGNG